MSGETGVAATTGDDPPPVLGVYERHGRFWAGLRAREPGPDAWLDRFCAIVPAASRVLDVGCGSGVPIATEMVRRGHLVTGVDGSATMVALFRRNLPGVPVHRADMRALALDARLAGILAWDSLFHLAPSDQRPMFARLAAHATPGAALMFTSGVEEGSVTGTLAGAPLYHGSLGPDEYGQLLDAAGFDLIAHVEADPDCGGRTVWLARMRG